MNVTKKELNRLYYSLDRDFGSIEQQQIVDEIMDKLAEQLFDMNMLNLRMELARSEALKD